MDRFIPSKTMDMKRNFALLIFFFSMFKAGRDEKFLSFLIWLACLRLEFSRIELNSQKKDGGRKPQEIFLIIFDYGRMNCS